MGFSKKYKGLDRRGADVLANLNEITGPRNQKQSERILANLNTLLDRESPEIAQTTDRDTRTRSWFQSSPSWPTSTGIRITHGSLDQPAGAPEERALRVIQDQPHMLGVHPGRGRSSPHPGDD